MNTIITAILSITSVLSFLGACWLVRRGGMRELLQNLGLKRTLHPTILRYRFGAGICFGVALIFMAFAILEFQTQCVSGENDCLPNTFLSACVVGGILMTVLCGMALFQTISHESEEKLDL